MLICPFFYLYHLVHKRLPIKSYFIEHFYADSPKSLCMNTVFVWFGLVFIADLKIMKNADSQITCLKSHSYKVAKLQTKTKCLTLNLHCYSAHSVSNLSIQNCGQQLYKIRNLGLLTWPRPVFSFLSLKISCQT